MSPQGSRFDFLFRQPPEVFAAWIHAVAAPRLRIATLRSMGGKQCIQGLFRICAFRFPSFYKCVKVRFLDMNSATNRKPT